VTYDIVCAISYVARIQMAEAADLNLQSEAQARREGRPLAPPLVGDPDRWPAKADHVLARRPRAGGRLAN
jgi:hypothetical protein